jgi:hypothetical protein
MGNVKNENKPTLNSAPGCFLLFSRPSFRTKLGYSWDPWQSKAFRLQELPCPCLGHRWNILEIWTTRYRMMCLCLSILSILSILFILWMYPSLSYQSTYHYPPISISTLPYTTLHCSIALPYPTLLILSYPIPSYLFFLVLSVYLSAVCLFVYLSITNL